MDHRMTPAPISVDRLRELLDKATPGPWVTDDELPGRVFSDDATGSIIAQFDGFRFAPRADDEMSANTHLAAAAVNALPALLHQLAELEAKLAELRQACWDARAVMGFDNDGDPTPDALVYPSLADLVRRDAAEFRKDYDEACSEAHAAERAREECVALVRRIVNDQSWRTNDNKLWPDLIAFLAASRGKVDG